MAKTNLRDVRVTAWRNDVGEAQLKVAYVYDTSDNEPLSKTRDITPFLTAAQLQQVTDFLAFVEARIRAREGIV